MTKLEALQAMHDGYKVRHAYYSPEEYIYIDPITGHIMTEEGYDAGSIYGEFWSQIQKWEDGWEIVEEITETRLLSDQSTFPISSYEYKRLPNYQNSFYSCPQYRRSEPKIQRNEPCPCNSGLKYKKCCGK